MADIFPGAAPGRELTGKAADTNIETAEILYPELCTQFRTNLDLLPDNIRKRELEAIVSELKASPYTQAFHEVGDYVTSRSIDIGSNKRTRIETLLRKVEIARSNSEIADLFKQQASKDYRIRVVKPDYPAESLERDIVQVKNCLTIEHKELVPEYAKWLKRDIETGACIYLIGEEFDIYTQEYTPKMVIRSYIAMPKSREPVLYIDSVEPGYIWWVEIKDWLSKARGRELLYSLAAVIYTARHIGIKKVAAGEEELGDLAMSLGFTYEDLFIKDPATQRKIGLPGCKDDGAWIKGGITGPYLAWINKNEKARVIHVDRLKPLDESEIASRLDSISGFLGSNHGISANSGKMNEISLFLQCLERAREAGSYSSSDISERVSRIRESYF